MQHRHVSSVGITKLDGEKVAADQPLQGYGKSCDAEGGLLPKWSVNISGMRVYVHFKKKKQSCAISVQQHQGNKAIFRAVKPIAEIKTFWLCQNIFKMF